MLNRTISVYQTDHDYIYISDGDELWNLGEVPETMRGGAQRDAQGWIEGSWAPTAAQGFTREPLTPIDGHQGDGLRFIAAYRAGQLHINADDGEPIAGPNGRRYLGLNETELP